MNSIPTDSRALDAGHTRPSARSESTAQRGQRAYAAPEKWGEAPFPLSKAGSVMRFFRDASLAYIAFALLAVTFLSTHLWFRGMREEVLRLMPDILAGVLVFGVVLALLARLTRGERAIALIDRAFPWAILGGSAVLFVVELLVVDGAWFLTDWDARALVSAAVYGTDWDTEYFSNYPNQTFLISVFSVIANSVSDGSYDGAYRAIVTGGCVCLTASTALVSFAAKKIGGVKVGLLTFVLTVLLVGLSPWMLVPYSDSYGTLFPALAIFLYVTVKNRPARLASVAFVSAVGYFVKPTIIFVLVAVLAAEAFGVIKELRSHRSHRNRRVKQILVCALAVVVALTAAFGIRSAAIAPYGGLDQDRALSAAHYLMMGANYDNNGRWTEDDYLYSASYDTPGERSRADLERWRQRMTEMGPVGVGKLFVKKTVNNYLDGTFWWEGEGEFYLEVKGDNSALLDFFNIGYEKNWTAGSSANDTPYFFMAQVVWTFVLAGCSLRLLNRRPSNGEVVVCCALLGLSLFLVVFECRARYLFLYSPYFMLVAALGWQEVSRRLGRFVNMLC